MGDMGDTFKLMREHNRKRKIDRYEYNTARVEASDLECLWRDDGIVARIETDDEWVDFWPSTGKWRFQGGENGWGFREMMGAITKQNRE